MNLIHIRDVYVQEGWHGWTKAIAVADHDQRISDPDLRRATAVEISLTIEDVFYEIDHLSGCRSDNPRSDCVPPVRLKTIHENGLSLVLYSWPVYRIWIREDLGPKSSRRGEPSEREHLGIKIQEQCSSGPTF